LNHDRRQAFGDRNNDTRGFGNHNGWNNDRQAGNGNHNGWNNNHQANNGNHNGWDNTHQANTSGDRWNRPSTGGNTAGNDRWNRPSTTGNTTGNTQQAGTQRSFQGWQNRGGAGGSAQQPAAPRTAPATTMQAGRRAQNSQVAMASRPAGSSFGGTRGGRR
jgi:translation initiation factor IF-2